jgi:hypothetical protein
MLNRMFGFIGVCLITVHVAGRPNMGIDFENARPNSKSGVAAAALKQQNPSRTPQHPDYNRPQRNTSAERPEWWLVWVTCGTLIIIGWQAIETHRATDAAQRSIRVLGGENRPWLLIEFEEPRDSISTPSRVPGQPARCTFRIGNYGRTPARLLSLKGDMAIGNSSKKPPTTDICENGSRFNPQIIPQNASLSDSRIACGDERRIRRSGSSLKHKWEVSLAARGY